MDDVVFVSVLLYDTNTNRMLVGLRSREVTYTRTWCPVSGTVECCESLRQAALREVKEETGYRGGVNLWPIAWTNMDGHDCMNFLGVVSQPFTPELNNEHIVMRWYDPRRIPRPRHPGFQLVLNSPELRRMIG